jgi:3-dehydroquinate dehydratase II
MNRMSKPIYVLNGPNLNRLGTREPEIYGHTTLAEVEAMCRRAVPDQPIVFRQSNKEHELIEWVHEAIDEGATGLVINPAAFTFTSMAIMDALKMFPNPIIELHITNIHRREPIYHRSYVSPVATAVIAGLGVQGYAAAVQVVGGLHTHNRAK